MAGNLRRAAEFVEMNLSQMGKDERRTRIGYKDQVRSFCRSIFFFLKQAENDFADEDDARMLSDETKSVSLDRSHH